MEAALQVAAALVNTGTRGQEQLSTAQELAAFAAEHDFSPSALTDPDQVGRVQALRARLTQAWRLQERDDIVAFLNAGLADADARPSLMRHDGWDWHLHFTPLGAPVERVALAETCMALTGLFTAGEWGRLRVCAAEDCDAVFVDLSRNRSKRYCDVGNCGNRANVAAYRARRREQGG